MFRLQACTRRGGITAAVRGARAYGALASSRIMLAKSSAPLSQALNRALLINTASPSLIRGYASASDYPEHIVVKLPALSPTMTSGSLQSWSVEEGDEVAAGDSLGEIETDKAVMSFDTTEDGFIAKKLVGDGTMDIPLGTPVLIIVEDEDDVGAFSDAKASDFLDDDSSAPAAAAEPEPEAPKAATPQAESKPAAQAAPSASSSGRVFASPLVKKMAEDAGVDYTQIQGSGPAGRIVKADLDSFLASGASSQPAAAAAASAAPAAPAGETSVDIPLTNVRKVIANRLQESKSTIPHYYLTSEIKVDNVLALRKDFNDKANGEYKLSVNDFVIKAAALACKQVPEVNSSWMDTFIRENHHVDISVAVSTDNGLITPIVFGADGLGLSSISGNVKELAAKARDNKLQPQEFQGGTFTISNLGMFGVKTFSAIINPPQSCILAVGSSEKQVVPDETSENGLGVAEVMSVTLSCDHRVVDGAVGATWLKAFKGYLENPVSMLL